MCNADRDSFVAELKATQKTLQSMAEPVKFTESLKGWTIAKDLAKYEADISALEMGDTTADERATNKVSLSKLTQAVEDGKEEAEDNKSLADLLKKKLI